MPKFLATVTVAFKPEILDPAGEATAHVLNQQGFAVESLRMGRHIALVLEAQDAEAAQRLTEEMAHQLLANPVMENYHVGVAAL